MVKEHKWTLGALGVLAALGTGALVARHVGRTGQPLAPDESLHVLRYDVTWPDPAANARLRAALPEGTPACRVVGESVDSSGLITDVVRDKRTGQRHVSAVPVPGVETRRLTVSLRILRTRSTPSSYPPKSTLSPMAVSTWTRPEAQIQTQDQAVLQALRAISRDQVSRGALVERIYEYCRDSIVGDEEIGAPDAAGAVAQRRATPLGRARAMVALCRAAKVPARLVCGFSIRSENPAEVRVWVESRSGKRWVPFDPEHGHAGRLPNHYLPVRRGEAVPVWTDSGQTGPVAYSVRLAPREAGHSRARSGTAWDILDLRRLPIGMQQALIVLLLLPVGALITAVWRNLIGLQTFGTFTPALLAMSFLYADWRTGGLVLVAIFLTALAGRSLLNRLRLLMVPRLGIILTLAVLCVAGAISAFDYFGLTPSAQAVILPLVVLTMMVERFFIRSEEDGTRAAVKLLTTTVVVAACCYAALAWQYLGRLVLRYPELEFFVAAALLLLGRYSGYRLTELVRFRDLARPGPGGRDHGA